MSKEELNLFKLSTVDVAKLCANLSFLRIRAASIPLACLEGTSTSSRLCRCDHSRRAHRRFIIDGFSIGHNPVCQLLSQLPITPFSPTRLSPSSSNDWNPHILKISASPVHTRHRGFDLLRVIAIYMVMQIHTGEFEYISSDGTVLHTAGSWAVGWTNSLLRVCVPLFVMITGFFLFPIEDERKFFRKRFTRVLIPFVIWCAVYAF